MHLCTLLVLILVTWTYGEQPSNYGNNVTPLSKESYGTRTKRSVTSPTAHPSPELVAVLTKQTEFVSSVLRKFLSLEVKWFYAMSRKSKAEVVVVLVVGITFTFIIILIPLLAKILVPPLPILQSTKVTDASIPDLDFPLPHWMDQTESWTDTYKSDTKTESFIETLS